MTVVKLSYPLSDAMLALIRLNITNIITDAADERDVSPILAGAVDNLGYLLKHIDALREKHDAHR